MALLNPWNQLIFIGDDYIPHAPFKRRDRFAAALVHDLDIALHALEQIGRIQFRRFVR